MKEHLSLMAEFITTDQLIGLYFLDKYKNESRFEANGRKINELILSIK
jgi:hypothetical protein